MSQKKHMVVVGSGPAGISAAAALLSKGMRVTLLDFGSHLDETRQRKLDSIKSQPSHLWPADTITDLKGKMESSTKGVKQKTIYGSHFPYRDPQEFLGRTNQKTHLLSSLALGGLSNVWGAAVLPVPAQDITGWPVSYDDLQPHYQSVSALFPHSAESDGLDKYFPLYAKNKASLNLSSQGQSVLDDLEKNKSELNSEGIYFGKSRLAVETSKCVYCGLCLSGCPYELIYNSKFTVSQLKSNLDFKYQAGFLVTHVEESGEKVTIHGNEGSVEADRVYIAGGVFSSTKIIAESLKLYDQAIPLLFSQYFMFPMLGNSPSRRMEDESFHTLSQIFLEVFNPDISAHGIHMQLYTYNDLYLGAIKNMLGPLYFMVSPLVKKFIYRLMIIQGYLHSNHSAQAVMKLKKGAPHATWDLHVNGNPDSKAVLRKLKKKISKNASHLGGRPIFPLFSQGPFGLGSHLGGTFPMRKNPGPLESDIWGRTHGLKRVHLVDSSVLPSLPASTQTLTVMANAHRIATFSGDL